MSNVINSHTFHDFQYLDLLSDVYNNGRKKEDRTGTGTISVFGREMRFDIRNNIIPVLTTKKMYLPALFHEIIWYLSGTGNIKYLRDNGIRIWNEWADENGDLGPVYGYQWRNWPGQLKMQPTHSTTDQWETLTSADLTSEFSFHEGFLKQESIDQIAEVIKTLKTNPDSRRIMVNAWNVGELDEMKLPPCHFTFQFYTEEMTLDERIWWWSRESGLNGSSVTTIGTHEGLDFLAVPRRYLSCKITQRSADMFLGVPFNIAQYSMLTAMIAQVTGMAARELIWSGGDCHIYLDHFEQVKEQLRRAPVASPILVLNKTVDNIDNFVYSDFSLKDYRSHGAIAAKVAV
jgi:thymidylate synthase